MVATTLVIWCHCHLLHLLILQVRWLSQGPQCSALSEVACGESTRTLAPHMLFLHRCGATVWVFLENWHFWSIFDDLLPILPPLKHFFQKSECVHYPHTRRHLCTKFDVLRLSESWDIIWRKKQSPTQTDTNPDRHPSYFAICEPRCRALRKTHRKTWTPDCR